MHMTFDSKANAAYIYLKGNINPGEVSRSEYCEVEMAGGPVFLHFDSHGHLIGIELLGAEELLLEETLSAAKALSQ